MKFEGLVVVNAEFVVKKSFGKIQVEVRLIEIKNAVVVGPVNLLN
jgi:hypothetical protein